MIGFGNVGQAFARLLISKKEWLRETYGLEVEVIAISTRTRGSLMSKKAIDLHRVLGILERGEIFRDSMPEHVDLSPLEIIEGCDANLMVELTTLNIDSGQPAIDHTPTMNLVFWQDLGVYNSGSKAPSWMGPPYSTWRRELYQDARLKAFRGS
jgi:homoserine dehydrogenase